MPQKDDPSRPGDIAIMDESKEQQDDLAPVRVFLLSDDETPTAALIEKRLRHVRQLYALSFMLRVPVLKDIEVIPVAALLLSTNPDSDLEDLVPLKLQIREAGTGTFWVDLFLQMLSHLPSGADLHQWADWLKNAQSALVAAASFCTVLNTYRKKLQPAGKDSADVEQLDTAKRDLSDTMKIIVELKDVSEDEKEQIRRAIAQNLEGILGTRWREFLQDLPPSSKTQSDT